MAKPTDTPADRPEVGDALGMIETRGLVGLIEAADAMLKTANVVLVSWQKVDAGLVTALIRGDVGSVTSDDDRSPSGGRTRRQAAGRRAHGRLAAPALRRTSRARATRR